MTLVWKIRVHTMAVGSAVTRSGPGRFFPTSFGLRRHSGCGWIDLFEGSKGFRDTINGVKVEVLIVGDDPGDGRPKPVSFPAPESVREVHDESVPYVNLQSLLELKIASGVTTAHRLQDLADAIQRIRVNTLPRDYSEQLNPFVRAKFDELWQAAQVSEDY